MDQNQIIQELTENFKLKYNSFPQWIARAPGRVNLIGEHTDYNDGFVFPLAISEAVWIAFDIDEKDDVTIYSLDYNETKSFDLDNITKRSGWCEYIKGVAHYLKEDGHNLKGWKGVMKGTVPIGAGLSSSAALEIASSRVFAESSKFTWEPAPMAKLCQKAENKWIGVNCGIMDQMISAAGKKDHALLLDCRSLEYEHVRLPQNSAIIILDTNTRRGLVDSEYNERRTRCENAAKFFNVKALRDVSLDDFNKNSASLDKSTSKRAKHVITEISRTLEAAETMKKDDSISLGKLMNSSHDSLRDDFEVSSKELDQIVNASRSHSSCYGARMTGAGFGGCAVALVKSNDTKSFIEHVTSIYKNQTSKDLTAYITTPEDGAMLIDISR